MEFNIVALVKESIQPRGREAVEGEPHEEYRKSVGVAMLEEVIPQEYV